MTLLNIRDGSILLWYHPAVKNKDLTHYRPVAQIPNCISFISHATPFVTGMCTCMHIFVTKWCIVGIWEMDLLHSSSKPPCFLRRNYELQIRLFLIILTPALMPRLNGRDIKRDTWKCIYAIEFKIEFWFHSLFPRILLTLFRHWLSSGLAPNWRQSIT